MWNPDLTHEVWTEPDGTRTVDFGSMGVDILRGTDGRALQTNDDGDHTKADLWMPYNIMIVLDGNPHVAIPQWPGERPWPRPTPFNFTLTIDDPSTPENPDYTDVQLVELTEQHVEFQLTGRFPIERSHIVTVSDDVPNDVVTKKHTIPNLWITQVDVDADIVRGLADPQADVKIWYCEGVYQNCRDDEVSPDGSGQWVIDLYGEFDIQPTSWIEVRQGNPDGDNSFSSWPLAAATTIDFESFEPGGQGRRFGVHLDDEYEGLDWANDTDSKVDTWGSFTVQDSGAPGGNDSDGDSIPGAGGSQNWVKGRASSVGKGAKITRLPNECFAFGSMKLYTQDHPAFIDQVTVTWRTCAGAEASAGVSLTDDTWTTVTAPGLGHRAKYLVEDNLVHRGADRSRRRQVWPG